VEHVLVRHHRNLNDGYLHRIDEQRVRSNLVRRLQRLDHVTVERTPSFVGLRCIFVAAVCK
jgi:hypothetical protein